MTGRCECGAEVVREMPADLPAWLRTVADRVPSVCERCIDQAEEERQRAEAEREAERHARTVQVRRERAGIPAGFHNLALEQIPDGHPAHRWADGVHHLLLEGPVGVGKTWAAAAAAWAVCEFRPVRFLTAPLLLARLGSGLGTAMHDEAVGILTGTTALVLDDLDKARPSEYAAEQVFVAVDGRLSNGVPLLVTTNLSLAELARRWPEPYGEAIASRIAGYCELHRMDGEDRRLLRP